MLRVERQPRGERQPALARRGRQALELGPGRLGVHVVDRDRGHAAPVVDARVEQPREVLEGEVRRRLHVHARGQQDARGGDRPEVVLHVGLRVRGHPRAGLGPEVLDDHLLEVVVLFRDPPERPQRVEALLARLADADQDPARERDRQLAREPDRLEPQGRVLVGRAPVRAALLRQPGGRRLEHDPHGGGDRPQRGEVGARHDARVQVGQEARLLEHGAGRVREVLERRLEAELGQLLARNAVAELRLVAEREEGLATAGGGARASYLEHLVELHEGPLAAPRGPREGAVAADVAAQLRQRDEDLRRVGDERPGEVRAALAGEPAEVLERRPEKRVVVYAVTSAGASKRSRRSGRTSSENCSRKRRWSAPGPWKTSRLKPSST